MAVVAGSPDSHDFVFVEEVKSQFSNLTTGYHYVATRLG